MSGLQVVQYFVSIFSASFVAALGVAAAVYVCCRLHDYSKASQSTKTGRNNNGYWDL